MIDDGNRGNKKPHVGKGNPPVEHRFKKGAPSPNPKGRPKGSKNKSDLETLLNTMIDAGYDSRGRIVRKRIREVINRRLVKLAAEGDLRAIKLVCEYAHKLAVLAAKTGPDKETMRQQLAEEAERTKLSAHIINLLDRFAQLKKLRIVDMEGGKMVIAPWVLDAASSRVNRGRPTDNVDDRPA